MGTLTVRLSDYDAGMLSALSETTGISKTDLVVEGLRYVFASKQIDSTVTYLSKQEFDDFLDAIERQETDSRVLRAREELENMKPVWEE